MPDAHSFVSNELWWLISGVVDTLHANAEKPLSPSDGELRSRLEAPVKSRCGRPSERYIELLNKPIETLGGGEA